MADSAKKTLLSGIQASGRLHIGNYFGAMKQFLDYQNEYESRIMVADYHALNTIKNAAQLKENTLQVIIDYLAIDLDPEKVILFKQSDVPAHTELTWIFNTLITVPYLERAHAFKDKVAKGIEPTVGLFDYPVLMATDILLYSPDVVPVGQDQKQHVEITREIARKFNDTFGETFKEPKEMIRDDAKVVPGIDGQKMSKSYNNTIPLFASDEEITKAVMGIVTDSGAGVPTNVYNIHKLFNSDIDGFYKENEGKYKILKEALIEDIKKFIAPLREKRESISRDHALNILKEGGMKAKEIADKKMEEVREKIGVKLY